MSEHEIGQFITIGLIIAAVAIFIGTRLFIVFRKQKLKSHWGSIVAGGLLDTTQVTQVTSSISLVILLLIFSSKP